MPQMPPLKFQTPLARANLQPVFVDRRSDVCRIKTLLPSYVNGQVMKWLADPAVTEGLNAPVRSMGIDGFRTYAASFDNIRRNLLLISMPDGEPVGIIMIEADLRHRLASLHIIIGEEDKRGMKITQAATRLALWHFFFERNFEKVTFEPLARNARAVGACRAALLRQEGEMKAHRIDGRTGERLDQIIFAMLRDEYLVRMRGLPTPPLFDGPGLPANFVKDTLDAVAGKAD